MRVMVIMMMMMMMMIQLLLLWWWWLFLLLNIHWQQGITACNNRKSMWLRKDLLQKTRFITRQYPVKLAV